MTVKTIFFEGLSNVGKSTIIDKLKDKLIEKQNIVFVHTPTNRNDTNVLDFMENLVKYNHLKSLKDEIENRFKYIDSTKNKESFTNLLLSNLGIIDNKLSQYKTFVELVEMFFDPSEEDIDIYILVDRTILSTLVYGYLPFEYPVSMSFDYSDPTKTNIDSKFYRDVVGKAETFIRKFKDGYVPSDTEDENVYLVYVERDEITDSEYRDDVDEKFDKECLNNLEDYKSRYNKLLGGLNSLDRFIKLSNNGEVDDAVNALLGKILSN